MPSHGVKVAGQEENQRLKIKMQRCGVAFGGYLFETRYGLLPNRSLSIRYRDSGRGLIMFFDWIGNVECPHFCTIFYIFYSDIT
jgi:hypothetical protein